MTRTNLQSAVTHGSCGRVVIIHPLLRSGLAQGRDSASQLEEAVGLAEAILFEIVDARIVKVARPSPSHLFGSGTVEQIRSSLDAACGIAQADGDENQSELDIIEAELDSNEEKPCKSTIEKKELRPLVFVNHPITPVQQRNLERAWKTKVIDRTGIILEIFGSRARTHEGKLQVELAALSYQRSRLVRSWTHLERQRGGFGFLGGPGESQLEADRRLISGRIERLERDLEDVRRTRALHRRSRKKVPFPIVALVGYTNAGKSTLFNYLSGAKVMAKDLLFATLDPAMRVVGLPSGRQIILSDTVGFISNLPTRLVAAFRATLEEVITADLIVHVRDAAHPDSDAQKTDVESVLRDLGLDPSTDSRLIEILNKVDLLAETEKSALLSTSTHTNGQVIALSALTGEGVERLCAVFDRHITSASGTHMIEVDLADGQALAWLYRNGEVIRRSDDVGVASLAVVMDEAALARFAHQFPACRLHLDGATKDSVQIATPHSP